jgi:AcrR family transcriptional regulator
MFIHFCELVFNMAREKQDPIQEMMVQARRNQILDAATAVFAEKGFPRATIRDVAKAAGIADGTIYNYFENKSALMLGILDRLNESERRADDLAQMADMDLREFFESYLRRRYEVFAEEGIDLFRAILSDVLVNPELRELYVKQIIEPTYLLTERHFARLATDGKVRPLDGPLLVRAVAAISFGVLMLWILGDPLLESRWEELPELLTTLIFDGIEPD